LLLLVVVVVLLLSLLENFSLAPQIQEESHLFWLSLELPSCHRFTPLRLIDCYFLHWAPKTFITGCGYYLFSCLWVSRASSSSSFPRWLAQSHGTCSEWLLDYTIRLYFYLGHKFIQKIFIKGFLYAKHHFFVCYTDTENLNQMFRFLKFWKIHK
jgi:hypothetical protein